MSPVLIEIARYVALGQAATNAIAALLNLAERHGRGEVTESDFDREIEAIDSGVRSANEADRRRLSGA